MAPRRSGTQLAATERLIFASQMGLATRAQVLGSGITSSQARTAVAQGRWVRIGPGVYGLAAWPASDARRILAACLVSGGVAGHLSAAWLWGLVTQAPSPPLVCVPHERRVERQGGSTGGRGLGAFEIRRSRDLNAPSYRYGIPTTNPLRTLVDLAGSARYDAFDSALDAALASRLVTAEGLLAEASRLERPGRAGPAVIKERLRQRAFTGAPSPSVLESQALRLLAANGIEVCKCEVVVGVGKYRLDIQLADRLFMEVDGYAYHWSPEHKRRDDSRRNRLRLLGLDVLVYGWPDIAGPGRAVVEQVREALSRDGHGRSPTESAPKPASPAAVKASS